MHLHLAGDNGHGLPTTFYDLNVQYWYLCRVLESHTILDLAVGGYTLLSERRAWHCVSCLSVLRPRSGSQRLLKFTSFCLLDKSQIFVGLLLNTFPCFALWWHNMKNPILAFILV